MTSHVYTMNKKKNSFVNTMVVFVPLFGAFALLAIICFLGVTLGKKYNKFMKETKKVPEELVSFLFLYNSHLFAYNSHLFVYNSHLFVYNSHLFVYTSQISFYSIILRDFIILFLFCFCYF